MIAIGISYTCALCGLSKVDSHHNHRFRHIASWNETVCEDCVSANWDGIVQERYPGLIGKLRKRWVNLQLNAKGLLPIPAAISIPPSKEAG